MLLFILHLQVRGTAGGLGVCYYGTDSPGYTTN